MKALNSIHFMGLAFLLALAATRLSSSPAADFAVEKVSLDRERMSRYLEAEAARLGREAWLRIETGEKLNSGKEILRKEFLFMLGLDPPPERTALQATLVRTIERGDYLIEVLHYQSLPGFYVTANLYRPRRGKGPFPATIWGPGHGSGAFGTKTSRQPHAALWARQGYICLVIDPVQAAEVYGFHHGLAGYAQNEWYSRGYTPMGIEVWNAMRGVDYLLSRKDVDGQKLTITGVSGGGHLSWMAGAADPRISVVQPAAGTADVLTHIRRNLQAMHCDCAYFINTYRHDWPTLAALIAPRPLLMHNSTGDAYYPPEGYLVVLEKARQIFGFYGPTEKTGMCEVPGPHGYKQLQREKAVEFSNRWLLGKKGTVKELAVEEVPEEQLGALGGIDGAHPANINARVHEILLPAAGLHSFDSQEQWEPKREEILKLLKEKVLRNLPRESHPLKKAAGPNDSFVLETEPGIEVGLVSHTPRVEGGIKSAVLYIASPGDTWQNSIWSFMKPFPLREPGTSKHMVFPRGIGDGLWNAVTAGRFEREALILGRTLDDMRLYDILCAVESIASDPAFAGCQELTVVGRGPQGILGAYAALLDSRITRVVLHSPPTTHRDGPHFLNVLRFTDTPQVLGLLAPRCELVFLTHEIARFGYTGDIYRLYGAEAKFRRCFSVTQALNLKPE